MASFGLGSADASLDEKRDEDKIDWSLPSIDGP
jgi:hypothetical protein